MESQRWSPNPMHTFDWGHFMSNCRLAAWKRISQKASPLWRVTHRSAIIFTKQRPICRPIHEEIESKIDELPAKENQKSKNYEETDANFRDESRVVSLQVDFVIGHRLGPDGSLNFKSSGLEVRYHGDQMLISHPLVAEFWFEGTRSKITCSISIHEMLFSTTVTLTGWVRSLGIIWPGCRTCAYISIM